MLAIKVRHRVEGDIELGAVSVGARVGHGDLVGLGVLDGEVLIIELSAVDRFSASAVALSEIAALGHEAGNDSVERAALVAEWCAVGSRTGISLGKPGEVIDSQRHGVAI